jgi:hypothetical protein
VVYGSKNLVETLHSHGFCASYNELRRYLTSLADHEINKIENGTYIPHGICNFRAYLQGGNVQISPVGGSGKTLSCVSASLLGWWKQIDRMHFHALTSEVPLSLF